MLLIGRTTTVPKSIVNFMKLEEGGILDWDLRVIDGKMTCVVSKFVATSQQEKKKHNKNSK